mmetsp:Transcript_20262/g.38223  ORF Transcript_20262/g.38223 Transcript_20262/m.38223 type:complete len:129 (-) Transcript_20262:115-501(-)
MGRTITKDNHLHKTQTGPHNNGILRHCEHTTFNYTAAALFVFVLRPYTQQSTIPPRRYLYSRNGCTQQSNNKAAAILVFVPRSHTQHTTINQCCPRTYSQSTTPPRSYSSSCCGHAHKKPHTQHTTIN